MMYAGFKMMLCVLMTFATLAASNPIKREYTENQLKYSGTVALRHIVTQILQEYMYTSNIGNIHVTKLTWIKDSLKTRDNFTATLLEILLADLDSGHALENDTLDLLFFTKETLVNLQVHSNITTILAPSITGSYCSVHAYVQAIDACDELICILSLIGRTKRIMQ